MLAIFAKCLLEKRSNKDQTVVDILLQNDWKTDTSNLHVAIEHLALRIMKFSVSATLLYFLDKVLIYWYQGGYDR